MNQAREGAGAVRSSSLLSWMSHNLADIILRLVSVIALGFYAGIYLRVSQPSLLLRCLPVLLRKNCVPGPSLMAIRSGNSVSCLCPRP